MGAGSGGASPGRFVAVTTTVFAHELHQLRRMRPQRLDHGGVELRAISGNREAFGTSPQIDVRGFQSCEQRFKGHVEAMRCCGTGLP